MSLYVVDSSVFNKLFLNEVGRKNALHLFKKAAEGSLTLIAPELLRYEVISTAQYYNLPIDAIVQLLEVQIRYNIDLVSPTENQWDIAIDLVKKGHPKSGYPAIYDAIFHAIAIDEGGIFVTADRKHFVKVKQEGHIILLKDLFPELPPSN